MKTTGLTVYCDGGSRGNPGPAAAAYVVYDQRQIISKAAFFLGETTNNVAEYQAVVQAMDWLVKNKVKVPVTFILDSQLVARQLNGKYQVKALHLKPLFEKIKEMEKRLVGVNYRSVARESNVLADRLLNEKLDAISR